MMHSHALLRCNRLHVNGMRMLCFLPVRNYNGTAAYNYNELLT